MGSKLGADEKAGVVDIGHKLEILEGHALYRARSEHPGIGDEQVERPGLACDLIHHLLNRELLGDIYRNALGNGDAGLIVQFVGKLIRTFCIHISDVDEGSVLDERTHHSFAKALCTTGDQGNLVPHHIRAAGGRRKDRKCTHPLGSHCLVVVGAQAELQLKPFKADDSRIESPRLGIGGKKAFPLTDFLFD
ncbi:hypothetical protein SDC9_114415 [bioreactor metagenome]|uniref:Uncharacterized protein n=1 Tax=bioreactor metagenome TaxID=1076179 RepID=A0A645BQL4_9ZZZZ